MVFLYQYTKRLFYAVCVCCTVFALLFYAPVPKSTEFLGLPLTIYYAGLISPRLVDGGLGAALWQFFLAMLIPGMICTAPLSLMAAWKYFRTANRFRTYCDAVGFVESINESIRCVNTEPTLLLSKKQKDRLIHNAKHMLGLYGFALIESGHVREGLDSLREFINAPKGNRELQCLAACGLLRYYQIFHDEEMTERCSHAVTVLSEKLHQEKRESLRELARQIKRLSEQPNEESLLYFSQRLSTAVTNIERVHLQCLLAELYHRMGDTATAGDYITQAKATAPAFLTVRKTEAYIK